MSYPYKKEGHKTLRIEVKDKTIIEVYIQDMEGKRRLYPRIDKEGNALISSFLEENGIILYK